MDLLDLTIRVCDLGRDHIVEALKIIISQTNDDTKILFQFDAKTAEALVEDNEDIKDFIREALANRSLFGKPVVIKEYEEQTEPTFLLLYDYKPAVRLQLHRANKVTSPYTKPAPRAPIVF